MNGPEAAKQIRDALAATVEPLTEAKLSGVNVKWAAATGAFVEVQTEQQDTPGG